ncbi:MAG: hypothetical protein ACTSQE_10740 [Candidatus Heimdallarchaeaceae archaeon]
MKALKDPKGWKGKFSFKEFMVNMIIIEIVLIPLWGYFLWLFLSTGGTNFFWFTLSLIFLIIYGILVILVFKGKFILIKIDKKNDNY